MFKTGVVTAIDTASAKVRVQFDALDGVVSYWLQMVRHKTLDDKHYGMPDINEHVLCALDENCEEGYILGAIYSSKDTPPVDSADKYHVTFKDGTILEYDRAEHKLFADVKGDVEALVTGDVTATVQGNVDVTAQGTGNMESTGALTVKSSTMLTLEAPIVYIKGATIGIMGISGSAMATITGNINMTGTLGVTGNITATGTIMDSSGNTNHHSHS